jgi:hypothetical protein
MAQVQISADTETKELVCSINGTVIPDIEDVSIYSYRDSNGNVSSLDVSLHSMIRSDDITVRISYNAYGSQKAQSAIASGQKVYDNIEGFIGVEDRTQAVEDIDKFLSSRKRGH